MNCILAREGLLPQPNFLILYTILYHFTLNHYFEASIQTNVQTFQCNFKCNFQIKFPILLTMTPSFTQQDWGLHCPNCGLIIGLQRFNVVYSNDLPETKFANLNEDTHSTCISKTDIKNLNKTKLIQ